MMPHLSSLILFGLAGGITPGPNNIMVMSSGANFGPRASLPHIIGICLGVILLQLMIGGGLYGLLQAFPWLYVALHVAALVYMLYLAWRMATATGLSGNREAGARPLTPLQAAAFQWVNPKAWSLGLAAITTFARPAHLSGDVATIAVAIGLVTIPSLLLWTLFGTAMRRTLASPGAMRFFNVTMAILLVLSLLPVLIH